MQSLDRLKNKLDSTESAEAFSGLQKAADKTDLSGIMKAIDGISDKFSTLRMVAINVLSDIASNALRTGEAIVKNLSTDNIAAGWEKYGQEVQAVQTIMVTLDDTPIEEVERQLKKIGWFSDETSYSYEQMVGSMSKLISSGVSLEDATNAVIGLSNAAAAAGVSTKKAEQAFYNFSQAFGAGYMQLQDWRSIELLNMATPEFKRNILQTAESMEKIVKVGDDLYSTVEDLNDPDSWFGSMNMRSSLKSGWFDKDVMNTVLGMYSEFTDQVYEMQEAWDMDTASETMAKLDEMGIAIDNVSNKAFRAAQEAKTFEEAIDSVKDAVSTKWKNTFKELFGNYEEAKVLWTKAANELYDLFAASGDVRNDILAQWNDPIQFLVPNEDLREAFAFPELYSGRDLLLQGLWNIYYSITNVVNLIKEAWREVFPQITAERLYGLTKSFTAFTARLRKSSESMEGFRSFLVAVFSVLKGGLNIIKNLIGYLGKLWPIVQKVGSIVLTIGTQILQFLKDAFDYLKGTEQVGAAVQKIGNAFKSVKNAILSLDESKLRLPTFKEFLDKLKEIKAEGLTFGGIISAGFQKIRDTFSKFSPQKALDAVAGSTEGIRGKVISLYETIRPVLSGIGNLFSTLWSVISTVFSNIKNGVSSIGSWIHKNFASIKFKDILVATIMGAMSWFTIRFSLMVGRVGNILDEFADLINSFSKILSARAFAIRMESLRNLGLTVLALVGAIYMFSKIDSDKVWGSVAAVVSMAGALVAISIVLSKVESKIGSGSALGASYSKEKGWSLHSGIRGTGIVSVVLGVAALAMSVRMLVNLSMDRNLSTGYLQRIVDMVNGIAWTLAAITAAMKVVTALATKYGGVSKFSLDSFYPISIALGMLGMIRVIKQIDTLDIKNSRNVIFGMIGIFTAFGIAGALLKSIGAGTGLGMLGIVGSIFLIVKLLDKLGDYDIDLSETGPAVLIVAGLVILFSKIAKLQSTTQVLGKGQKLRRTSVSMVGIIFGLMAAVGAIYLLSQLTTGELIRGAIGTFGLLVILFGGMSLAIFAAGKAGEHTGKGLLGLSAMLIAVSIFTAVLTLAYAISPKNVFFASLTMMAILGMVALIGASLKNIGQIGGTLTPLAVIIGLIGGIMAALYVGIVNDPKAAMGTVAGISFIMIAIGAMFRLINKSMSNDLLKKSHHIVILIGAILLELGVAVVLLSNTVKDNPNMIKAVTSMSILALGLGGMIRLLAGVTDIKKAIGAAVGAGIVAVALGGVVIALSWLVNGDNLSWLKDYGIQLAALAGVILAVFAVATLLGQGGPAAMSAAFYGSVSFAIVVGMLLAVVGALAALKWLIFDKLGADFEGFKDDLRELIEVFYLMGAVFGALVSGALVGATPLAAKSISDLAANLKPFAETISTFPDNFAEKSATFGKGILSLSWYGAISNILGGFGEKSNISKMINEMAEIMPKLTDISDNSKDLHPKDIEKFADSVEALSGAAKYSMSAPIRTALAVPMVIEPLIDSVSKMDKESIQKASEVIPLISNVITEFAATMDKFPASMGLWQLIAGDKIEGFRLGMKQLKILAEELPIDEFTDMNKDDVTKVGEITKSIFSFLSDFAKLTGEFENSGGAWQWLTGTKANSLEKLPELANSIVGYGKILLDPSNVNAVTAAANVTNNLGDAFHNLADQNLKDRIDSITQAMKDLTDSGIGEIQYYFTDERSKAAFQMAVDNFIHGFRDILFAEAQFNTLGGYFQWVLDPALVTIANYSTLFYNKGRMLNDEFVRGISGEERNSAKAGLIVAKGVVKGVTDHLQEKSPSKLMFEKGYFAGKGLIQGVESTYELAEKSGENLGAAFGGGVAGGLSKTLKKLSRSKEFAISAINPLITKKSLLPSIVPKGSEEGTTTIDGITNSIENLKGSVVSFLDDLNIDTGSEKINGIIDSVIGSFTGGYNKKKETTEISAGITEGILSNMPYLTRQDVKTVVGESVKAEEETKETIVEQLVGEIYEKVFGKDYADITAYTDWMGDPNQIWESIFGGEAPDYTSYMEEFQKEYENTLGYVSDNPISSVMGDTPDFSSALPRSYGSQVADYTAEDIRNLSNEIYNLEDALYALKEAMKDQRVTHTGELTVRYTNESDFIDRIQTSIISSIRREARV